MAAYADPKALLDKVCQATLPPPPVLTISEWADQFRILGSEESSEPGRWRTERVPYLREIMDSISDPDIRSVALMASARVGKTSALNNTVGYYVSQDPCPILVVLPTGDLATYWSQNELTPMLRNTPILRGIVADAKSKDGNNSIAMKVFKGGYIAVAGANSPNGLSSKTVRVVALDEVDKIAAEAGKFGSPIELAKKRTTTYPGRDKHLLFSTPGVKNQSVIEAEFQAGDARRYYLPHPCCGHWDYLRWSQMVWPDGKPHEAVYACPACGTALTEGDKLRMLPLGQWRPTNPNAPPWKRSYHLSEMYSPWSSWGAMASSFVEKNRLGPSALKTFINESLGETWDDRAGETVQAEGLAARRETWIRGTVPAGVALLIATVDVQGDRLEMLVYGAGPGEEGWIIDHRVFYGNLATSDPWDRLEEAILAPYEGLRITCAALDTGGGFTRQAYAFARRPRMKMMLFPVKGASQSQRKFTLKSKRQRLWLVETVMGKDTVLARLKIPTPGPGYIHFPQDLDLSFFGQLLSERPVRRGGKRAYEKFHKDDRNEALDMLVYALAALDIYQPSNLQALVDRRAASLKTEPAAEAPVEPKPEPVAEPATPPPQPQPSPRPMIPHRPMMPRRPLGW